MQRAARNRGPFHVSVMLPRNRDNLRAPHAVRALIHVSRAAHSFIMPDAGKGFAKVWRAPSAGARFDCQPFNLTAPMKSILPRGTP